MKNEIELEQGQIVEVEYNPELVAEYKDNYIMEEEGVGAETGEVYGEQDTFNTDTIEELISDDTVIDSIEVVGEEDEHQNDEA